jgi:hypothetical protein
MEPVKASSGFKSQLPCSIWDTRVLPHLLGLGLALLLTWGLMAPGYIFSLDLTPEPLLNKESLFGLDTSPYWYTAKPISAVVVLLKEVGIPMTLVQRIWIVSALYLSGVGMYYLMPREFQYGRYVAGLIYMVNPYVYIRLIAGQWGLAVSYALVPFLVKAFLDMMDGKPGRPLIVALLATLIGAFSIHGVFFSWYVVGIFALVGLGGFWRAGKVREALPWVRSLCLAMGLYLILNLYWIAPFFLTADWELQRIRSADLSFFRPVSSTGRGPAFDILIMYGFWNYDYAYPSRVFPFSWFYWVPAIAIGFLGTYGAWAHWRHIRIGPHVKAFAVLLLMSYLLALGGALTATELLWQWLMDHLGFIFRGLRDTHKFVGVMALCYALLAGLGAGVILNRLFQRGNSHLKLGAAVAAFLVLLSLPFIAVPTIFNSFWGHLQPAPYPPEWHEAKELIDQDPEDAFVLFLPWHRFMAFSWMASDGNDRNKVVANPARFFFDKPVIQSERSEVAIQGTVIEGQVSRYIGFLLRNRGEINNLGELLAVANIKYVVLAKEVDYMGYGFLRRQEDLELILENEKLVVFENLYPTARSYQVNSVKYIHDWEELIESSKTEDLMEHLYLLEPPEMFNDQIQTDSRGLMPLQIKKNSLVNITIEEPTSRYFIMTLPQRNNPEGWRYKGQTPYMNLGIQPAWPAQGEGTISYVPFSRIFLPFYTLSILGLLAFISVYFFGKRNKFVQG